MRQASYQAELAQGNIGVALGGVSGNLISVDVDDDAGLEDFLQVNVDIADTLRSRGRRGGNVWYRMDGEYPRLKKLKRHGEDWGEWRSTGGQTIIYGEHPDGGLYTISNRKPPLLIPFKEIRWPEGVTGPTLQKSTEADRGTQRTTESHLLCSSAVLCAPLCSSVKSLEDAVRIALPKVENQNNSHLFKLARALKTIELRDGPLSTAEKVKAFSQWHALALARGVLRKEQTRDEYLAEFLRAYKRAKFPMGMSPLVLKAFETAQSEPTPPEAEVFESPQARLLVTLCRNIHKLSEGKEWFIAARTAGPLIGVSHTSAASYLSAMVHLGLLDVLKPATATTAPRYAYTA